jgi:hypothetical protein
MQKGADGSVASPGPVSGQDRLACKAARLRPSSPVAIEPVSNLGGLEEVR